MAKVTLYVPNDLWERMQKQRDINWSRVFQHGVRDIFAPESALGSDETKEPRDERSDSINNREFPALFQWRQDVDQRLDTLTRSVKSHHRALSVMGVGVEYQPVEGDQT